jgi:hypothetical protein
MAIPAQTKNKTHTRGSESTGYLGMRSLRTKYQAVIGSRCLYARVRTPLPARRVVGPLVRPAVPAGQGRVKACGLPGPPPLAGVERGRARGRDGLALAACLPVSTYVERA